MWQKNLSSRVHVCNLNALTSPKERASTIRKWKSGVLLSTEGILKSCIDKSKTLVTALKPDVLVLDEAHTLICTATKRYEMLESIKPRRVIGTHIAREHVPN
jgi:hypothetical protein